MASVSFIQLLDVSALAASQTGDGFSVDQRSKNLALVVLSENQSSANFSVQAQHSSDGTNWIDLGTAVTVNSDTVQLQSLAAPVLPNVRVDVTRTGGTVDLDVRLHFDPDK